MHSQLRERIRLMRARLDTGGNKRQVPAKRQNRGSRNSKDDGG
ncbi:single-stranded DNA-binding protein [Escherichia coli]|nr:single-stranded DNA-binding protein [Escherichia coli]